jgi:BirA family transcriptional regulator, biotin operon repressor / biotin---[acetyl-CoA-carboxylase] ligase
MHHQKTIPDIEFIWLKLIESFEKHLSEFNQHGFGHFHNSWKQWDAYDGQSVCISGAGREPIFGSSVGVDNTGALLLNQHDKTIAIHAGDVSLRVQS